MLLTVLVFFNNLKAQDTEVQLLLEKTKTKGGLCLIIGAKDLIVVESLAKNSNLYIQVLQSDVKVAATWGQVVANSANRENLGVRNAAFDSEHYGSDLFNLIIVEDASVLGKAKLADLYRILVPKGFVALKNTPSDFVAEAKKLDMSVQSAGAYATICQKPVKPMEWKICDSLKWRAGPRAQLSTGWSSVKTGDGKFIYREQMESPGTLEASDSQLFARDAQNGRLLWTIPEDKWRLNTPRPLATANGKIFTALGDKLVCLDSNTGKLLFEILPKGLDSRWSLGRLEVVDELLLASGEFGFRAFSINDGKELWKLGGVDRWISHKGKLITSTERGHSLQSREIKDPSKILWTVRPEKMFSFFCSEKHIHINQKEFVTELPSITTLNLETGETVWSYVAESIYKPKRNHSYEYFDDKFYIMTYNPYESKTQDFWMTRLDINTGKVEAEDCGPKGAEPFNMCAPVFHKAGKYLVYFFSVWVDLTNNARVFPYLAHPSCAIGTIFSDGLMYNIPSRKAGALQGLSAMGPADIKFDQETGGKIFRKYADTKLGAETKEDEWPMFRASMERGNAVKTSVGDKPFKLWEASLGLASKSFGVMSGERTGLTQPVCAGGLVVVADMDAQRIIGLDAVNGKQKWVFPVGSRVDFSPTLYKGLCLFAAKDGWVFCLNATDGTLAWKLLITPHERLIGGQDKLESQWPMVSDVLVVNGLGYVSAGLSFDHLGGVRAVGFKPETGEVVWSQTYYDEKHVGYGCGNCANMFVAGNTPKGLALDMSGVIIDPMTGKILRRGSAIPGTLRGAGMDDFLGGGVSVPRNAEDRGPVGFSDDRIWGKTIAFDKDLSVAYSSGGGAETWVYKGKLNLYAKKVAGKQNLWEKLDSEMTVDDLVLTPQFIYAVGHYQRVKKDPELLVISREDGTIINTIPVEGFPSYMGMSAAGNSLYIATREGKVLCFKGAK
jgi:outer membrane protein assembly factor BamB